MPQTIKLLEPQTDLKFPLMQALQNRRSKRKWQDAELSDQELSNLLWATCGITRLQTKYSKSRRTAPSASNSQAIKVYVAMQSGLYRYEETDHQLVGIHTQDIRSHIGTQKMMQSAPLGLVYVSDFTKFKTYAGKDEQTKLFVSGTDTGFISQNVYLYCAAANLNTVILGLVDREKLHDLMELHPHEKVIYSQVVGKALDKK